MPRYKYTALDANGREQEDIIEAASGREAISLLRSQNLFPTKVKLIEGQEISTPDTSAPHTAETSAEVARSVSVSDRQFLFPENSFKCKLKEGSEVTPGFINILGQDRKTWLFFEGREKIHSEYNQLKIPIDDIREVLLRGFFRRSLLVSTNRGRCLEFVGNFGKVGKILEFEMYYRAEQNKKIGQ